MHLLLKLLLALLSALLAVVQLLLKLLYGLLERSCLCSLLLHGTKSSHHDVILGVTVSAGGMMSRSSMHHLQSLPLPFQARVYKDSSDSYCPLAHALFVKMPQPLLAILAYRVDGITFKPAKPDLWDVMNNAGLQNSWDVSFCYEGQSGHIMVMLTLQDFGNAPSHGLHAYMQYAYMMCNT